MPFGLYQPNEQRSACNTYVATRRYATCNTMKGTRHKRQQPSFTISTSFHSPLAPRYYQALPPRRTMYQPAAASAEAYGAVHVRRRGHEQQQPDTSNASSAAAATAATAGQGHYPPAQRAGMAFQQQQQQQQQHAYHPNAAYGTPAAPVAGGNPYTGTAYAPGYATSSPPGVGSSGSGGSPRSIPPPPPSYRHNRSTAIILLPSLACLLLLHPTPHPLTSTLFTTLVLYIMDLANFRDGTALGIWIGFALCSVSLLSGLIVGGEDDSSWSMVLGRLFISILLLLCLAFWETMQFKWLYREMPTFALSMERMLHLVLPLASSSVLTYHSAVAMMDMVDLGSETASIATPLVFLLCMAVTTSMHGAADSSFASFGEEMTQPRSPTAALGNGVDDNDDDNGGKSKGIKSSDTPRAITPNDGRILSLLMLAVPLLIYTLKYRKASGGGLNLILMLTAPYVAHYLLIISGRMWWAESLPLMLRTGTMSKTLRGALVPIIISTVASIAFQLKFILPICDTASFLMNGHETQSPIFTTISLMLSSLSGVAGVWLYGRKNQNDEALFGEYQEDVFQMILATSGVFLGLALGMSWRLLPLPALSFLAISIYVVTRMFRYYVVLLFVAFTTFSFFVQYRFLYIEQKVDLVFGYSASMNRFGMVGISIGLVLLSVVGLVYRATDGWGTEHLKRLDVAGVILSTYAFLVIPLEAILLKTFGSRSTTDFGPVKELLGTYRPFMALITGGILICISWHLKKTKYVKSFTSLATVSAAAGKMLSVIIDIFESSSGQGESTTVAFTMRAFSTALLLIALFGPNLILTPGHQQNRVRLKRTLGPSGKPADIQPDRTNMIVVGYCGIILPAAILSCVPLVLIPLMSGLRGNRFYYNASPPISEIIGLASCIWGIATLSMTNHFLPDGGAEVWRKASALMFCLGLGLFFVAPSLPWSGSTDSSFSDEFASISSAGLGIGQGRTGGFGLVSAALATLLALTGPLELRDRRAISGGKDRTHLLRLMVFSILFGCGVAWFVGIQSMGGEPFLSVFMTITACMATAFLGTVACVLGYSVESQSFDEVQQMAKLWLFTSSVFVFVAGVSSVSKDGSPPFGLGGWLSTYLAVFSMTALAFTIAVGIRRDKTSVTRALGNLTCILSWLLAILCIYGQFGLAGIGVVSGTLLGIPTSIIGTFAAAPILLFLEGEAGETISNRRTYNIAASSGRRSLPTFGITFQSLTRANRFSPPLVGTVSVLLIASIHAVLFRGCGLLSLSVFRRGEDGTKNAKDIFSNVYSFLNKVTGAKQKEDVVNRTNVLQSKAVASAAKLAAASVWTSHSFVSPMLHLAGIASVLPSLYLLVSSSWSSKEQSASRILTLLPLNLVPLFICRGIPSLWAAAVFGIVGGILQAISSRQRNYVSHMRM